MDAVATMKAYLDLCRVSNLPTVWTNVLAASLLANGSFEAGPVLLAAVSLSCFYLGGMALNDLWDRESDRATRPSRPIPSGSIPLCGARSLILLLFAAGFLMLAFACHLTAVLAALLLLAAIVLYDRHHKQNPFSVLIIASCRLLVFVVAALAVSGRLPAAVVVAGFLQFCYVVLLSLVARHENKLPRPFPFPVIPVMLAAISLLDGMVLAVLAKPYWLVVGMVGFLLTLAGQRFARGD
ncbi:MAG: prenyltransferase [Geobacteraceae bacterium GWC2_58_44]|nr:MAG: prenyltransferase [Geobacteraceae bacterium GWC2_58_44]HBG05514.1 prenyltransferase [Geobacter sp.]